MIHPFEIAVGSVPGRDHTRAGKNNQDAWCYHKTHHGIVGVVCDGCGSGAHSEVGARLGARIISHSLTSALARAAVQSCPNTSRTGATFWERIRLDVTAQLRVLAYGMGDSLAQTVQDFFLFTVIGVVLTDHVLCIFSCGDGIYAINGATERLGPFPGNAPPYLAYGGLIPVTGDTEDLSEFRFQVNRIVPAREVESVLIGTDGVQDLIEIEERNIPGTTEPVGPLSQFWTDDRYYTNADRVRRTLFRINQGNTRLDTATGVIRRDPGLLPDDTTFLTIRRKPEER